MGTNIVATNSEPGSEPRRVSCGAFAEVLRTNVLRPAERNANFRKAHLHSLAPGRARLTPTEWPLGISV
jgi:hypothetical protein